MVIIKMEYISNVNWMGNGDTYYKMTVSGGGEEEEYIINPTHMGVGGQELTAAARQEYRGEKQAVKRILKKLGLVQLWKRFEEGPLHEFELKIELSWEEYKKAVEA